MKIGIWNIDHPELGTRSRNKQARLEGIIDFLYEKECDIYILSEANSAIKMDGYRARSSAESPFIKKSRSYESPNCYHQVAIYSRLEFEQKDISEPINGVLCKLTKSPILNNIYGNVITIKDQWKKDSALKFTDRLNEQVKIIGNLPSDKTIVAGDFNLKLGWTQKAKAYKAIEQHVELKGWIWPTREQTDSVQHILHSPDIRTEVELDRSVKEITKLSDHPFVSVLVS